MRGAPLQPASSPEQKTAADMAAAIRLENVCFEIGSRGRRFPILHNIELLIPRGQFAALVGPSGSGKSTLLGLIGGFDLPSAGDIYIEGINIAGLSEGRLAKIRNTLVGMVFQSFYLIPTLTALENVELPLYLSVEKNRGGRARELLGQVGLSDRLNHKPNQLSGGEQQRVAIARALACRPKVLLADEPTGNLDLKNGRHIWELLKRVRSEVGSTLIVATHNLELAKDCDRVIHLVDGRLVQGG